jgi:hypothetical protein
MTWVWQHSRADGNVRLVLLAIADSANDDGLDAWPSINRLCQKTRLSERTVRRCVRELEQLGELRCLGGRRGAHGRRVSNRYEVTMASSGQIDRSTGPTTGQPRPEAPANLTGRIEDEPSRDPSLSPSVPPRGDAARVADLTKGARAEPAGDASGDDADAFGHADAPAEALASELWATLMPKPLAGFRAFQARVRECLAAGYTREALRRVAPHVAVWSHAGIETAFARTRMERMAREPAPVSARVSEKRERAESVARSQGWAPHDTGWEAAVEAATAGEAVPMPVWMQAECVATDLWLEMGPQAAGGYPAFRELLRHRLAEGASEGEIRALAKSGRQEVFSA